MRSWAWAAALFEYLKVAVKFKGVGSVVVSESSEGLVLSEELVVTGVNVDIAKLMFKLRKKVGETSLTMITIC
ncbi:hypothetical protein SESBI_08719 [Sesbania bispinosa]|nr:hypothetical protein SESBI_08719 [Sesbania bispinosa]